MTKTRNGTKLIDMTKLFKKKENDKNKERNEKLRSDNNCKIKENNINKNRIEKCRLSDTYKTNENQNNAKRITDLRNNPHYVSQETIRNKEHNQNLRSHPVNSVFLMDKDKARKRQLRLDELYTFCEKFYNDVKQQLELK
ncbi:hypothetical protein TKK_0014647 [Trichogramma kaykai]